MNNPYIDKNSATLDLTFPYFPGANVASGYAQGFKYLRRCFWNGIALAVGDTLGIVLALLIAGAFRKIWFGEAVIHQWNWLLIPTWLLIAFGQRLLPSWGIGSVEELRRVVVLLAGAYGIEAGILFLAKESDQVSRIVLICAFLLTILLIPLVRVVVKRLLTSYGVWGVPTVVYADQQTAVSIIEALREQKGSGYVPVGVFSNEQNIWNSLIEGLPVLGPLDLATSKASVAILATRGLTCERVLELLDGSLASYRHVIIQPDLFGIQSLWVRASNLGGLPGLEISLNLLDPVARWSKQLFELILVTITLPIWGGLCLLLALLVWLEDRNSPFFVQKRIGKNGKLFFALKFRTMVPNAEQVLQQKLSQDAQLAIEWNNNFKLKNDPRITRVGKFLRKTSLDELPQLFNVLKGDMSLVGPRPLPSYHHLELTTPVRNLRERVRPGITGLWQVSGRSSIGTDGMERWDAFYVRNWSIWLDIVILARTIKVVTQGTGAY